MNFSINGYMVAALFVIGFILLCIYSGKGGNGGTAGTGYNRGGVTPPPTNMNNGVQRF